MDRQLTIHLAVLVGVLPGSCLRHSHLRHSVAWILAGFWCLYSSLILGWGIDSLTQLSPYIRLYPLILGPLARSVNLACFPIASDPFLFSFHSFWLTLIPLINCFWQNCAFQLALGLWPGSLAFSFLNVYWIGFLLIRNGFRQKMDQKYMPFKKSTKIF